MRGFLFLGRKVHLKPPSPLKQMDADYDPNQQPASKRKKQKERKKLKKEDLPLMSKKSKKSHFAEVLTQKKPVFDPRRCHSGSS